MSETTAEARVSERIGNVARISSRAAIKDLTRLEEATVEVIVNGALQRLPVAQAAEVGSALLASIDYLRAENPLLLIDLAPSPAEIELVKSTLEWAVVLQSEGRALDTVTHSGIERSMLLRRIRSGLPAMKEPPPTSFGQPWYEILEGDPAKVHKVATDGKLTTLAELLGTADASATARSRYLVQVNGCHWTVMKTVEFARRFLVSYEGHPQVFELEKGEDGAWTLRRSV